MSIYLIPRFPFEGPDGSPTTMQAAHFRALGERLKPQRSFRSSWRFYGEGDADHTALYLFARGMGFEGSEIERMWYRLREDPMLTADVDNGIHGGTTTSVMIVSAYYLKRLLATRYSARAMERAQVEPGSLWIITRLPPHLVAAKTSARKPCTAQ